VGPPRPSIMAPHSPTKQPCRAGINKTSAAHGGDMRPRFSSSLKGVMPLPSRFPGCRTKPFLGGRLHVAGCVLRRPSGRIVRHFLDRTTVRRLGLVYRCMWCTKLKHICSASLKPSTPSGVLHATTWIRGMPRSMPNIEEEGIGTGTRTLDSI
jgi:hypothetical protein